MRTLSKSTVYGPKSLDTREIQIEVDNVSERSTILAEDVTVPALYNDNN
jgi:hypothetical protein